MTAIRKALATSPREGFILLGFNGKIKGLQLFVLTSLVVHVVFGALLLMCPKTLSRAQVYELEVITASASNSTPAKQKTVRTVRIKKSTAPELNTKIPSAEAAPLAAQVSDSSASSEGSEDSAVYSVNQLHQAPRLLKEVKAVYPPKARAKMEEGHVLFEVIVRPDGKPSDIRKVESSNSVFEEAAKKAVEQLVFRPGLKDGQEVAVRIQYRVRFLLR